MKETGSVFWPSLAAGVVVVVLGLLESAWGAEEIMQVPLIQSAPDSAVKAAEKAKKEFEKKVEMGAGGDVPAKVAAAKVKKPPAKATKKPPPKVKTAQARVADPCKIVARGKPWRSLRGDPYKGTREEAIKCLFAQGTPFFGYQKEFLKKVQTEEGAPGALIRGDKLDAMMVGSGMELGVPVELAVEASKESWDVTIAGTTCRLVHPFDCNNWSRLCFPAKPPVSQAYVPPPPPGVSTVEPTRVEDMFSILPRLWKPIGTAALLNEKPGFQSHNLGKKIMEEKKQGIAQLSSLPCQKFLVRFTNANFDAAHGSIFERNGRRERLSGFGPEANTISLEVCDGVGELKFPLSWARDDMFFEIYGPKGILRYPSGGKLKSRPFGKTREPKGERGVVTEFSRFHFSTNE
ncbi:hypothetical protein HYW53_00335 [Candidatus Giovannonibacteria bacterium]|nr:hypothetical protein [Candidatus Giovannonibacteria bacterium]